MDVIPTLIAHLAEGARQVDPGLVLVALVLSLFLAAAGWWAARRRKNDRA